ncbi:elongation factor G-like protein [Halanaerobium saccharolyticum]|uniref:Elongation factor G-like protein n=1 Tax=Halanaerobium saccharolyticum TaxID=43595 RepID=A0A4R7YYQ3_9FIRM|nr:TetM/TetW/TetO/TetS family tetracycline resistance ribosomal protection protein [Halanaerobium saccharolyticum]RAK06675.1 elongation factor G-like protein [Halanaerobium saccharolyticum]TDW01312.1 elongation factor G-like protein [Halanaerobium saccharolyticum]TDX52780.1 elongation factor G-like protein [Halanaerobium saccharolyticum]
MIIKRKIFIAGSGSALNDQGVKEFFDQLALLTDRVCSAQNGQKLQALLYKISHDQDNNRVSHIKVVNGSLKVREELEYEIDQKYITEKITELRIYNGQDYHNVNQVKAGEIAGVLGLSKVGAGTAFGELDSLKSDQHQTALKSKVIYDKEVNTRSLLKSFKILDAEDPSLEVGWNSKTEEIQINVIGTIQLEILKSLIKERFNFENRASTDDLNRGLQNLVKQHILEREHRGILTGSPLTDLKIILLTGKSHNKHTSGGDFKEATYRALRQGLEKSKNILLEPFYEFKIKINLDYLGRVISDIEKAKGSFEPPDVSGEQAVIRGQAPAATFMDYPLELRAFTGGKGIINFKFGGYDLCHNSEQIIKESNYNKNKDGEYSSSSIFCSRGKGYTVPWDQAESKMHCL